MAVPQKIEKYDLAIPLMGTYPKKMKTLILKHVRTPIYNSQAMGKT